MFSFDTDNKLAKAPLLLQGSYNSGKTWKTWKRGPFEKNQGKPGKLREFSDHIFLQPQGKFREFYSAKYL